MLSDARWKTITESEFAWERNALEFLRKHLPDRVPYRAWTNFEFVADNGKVYEVDALILAPRGLFLVEIKSDLGTLEGDALTWTWTTPDGRRYSKDNPLLLANRKAKQLGSLLRQQKSKPRIYIPPIIYCSANGLNLKLSESGAHNVYISASGPRGIIEFLTSEPDLTMGPDPIGDHRNLIAIEKALDTAGVRRSNRARRVGQYELTDLLAEADTWQDWLARNPDFEKVERRIRLYPYRLASSKAAREKLRRAVKREFDLLAGIEHPGILKPHDPVESDQGPALIFNYDPTAMRLDHYLERNHSNLPVEARLHLMRQIAETIAYAHSKKIVHRALSPLSVLVIKPDQAKPEVKIFDWQAGFRRSADDPTTFEISPTSHVEEMVDSAASAYMAPESFSYPDQLSETADIFSLGAIAYHVFSGQRPAEHQLQLHRRLLDTHQGLQLAAVVDGANEHLQQLIAFSTDPEVYERPASVDEFLDLLHKAECELLPSDEEPEDPAEAREGSVLPGDFVVKKRLGTGATSSALLVERDRQESVLKIARSIDDNALLEQEAEVLKRLQKPEQAGLLKHRGAKCFPEFRGTPDVGSGRAAILMSSAGERTLAKRLRDDGKLHIDMLARLGEQLLHAVDYLDRVGINHRDIKPANIGVNEGSGGPLHLTLFDFSLSRVPPENIRAGTRPYLDPFLELRKEKKWDVHAERFAAAMTLYEMATGTLPRWGDGRSAAELISEEAMLAPELFDPSVRDGLASFFAKALRRRPSERYESAEKMLEEWQTIFEHIDRTTSSSEGEIEPAAIEAAVAEARLDSAITLLPFTVRAQSVLQRLDIHRVSDLLRQRAFDLYRLSEVGNPTRREIGEMWRRLDQRFGHSGGGTDVPEDGAVTGRSIEAVLREVLTRKDGDDPVVQQILGMTAADGEFEWPSERSVADRLGLQRVQIVEVLHRLRERWRDHAKSLTLLRDEIFVLLHRKGGVIAARELARDVLTLRGSAHTNERIRAAKASAVARAAVETERTLVKPRFALFRSESIALIAEDSELAQWAQRLGREADRIAAEDPLLGSTRVLEELQRIKPPASQAVRLAPHDLIALAASASRSAACNTGGEIYPRKMEAVRALKLTRSALAGIDQISDSQLQTRVAGRYPQAEPLPLHPGLDKLVREAELGFEWNPDADRRRGAYINLRRQITSASSGSSSLERSKTLPGKVPIAPEELTAAQFEQRLLRALKQGAFLALAVRTAKFLAAERELLRFPVTRLSIDQVLIRAIKQQAAAAGAQWSVVVRTDTEGSASADWHRLLALVQRAMPDLQSEIEAKGRESTMLLTDLGLLARYEQVGFFTWLRENVGARNGIKGAWVLFPSQSPSPLPMLDGRAIPILSVAQWARIPNEWIKNLHRGAPMPLPDRRERREAPDEEPL